RGGRAARRPCRGGGGDPQALQADRGGGPGADPARGGQVTALVAAERAQAARPAGQPPSVVVSGAIRRYPGGRSVGPIDIDVRAGEVLAFMGSNGAGKSTLLRLLATADRTDGGRVSWWGDPSPRRARRQMGYAADEPIEETTLSPRQATYFWCRQWVGDADLARRLTSETLDTLSYGLRRRLALAQALAHRPALALFDEPSAGLDPDGAAVVTSALRAGAAAGRTNLGGS